MNVVEKEIKLVLIFGIALTIVSPLLFTLSSGLVDFSTTGGIGDTIGGITSPIVGLVGSILVFYALKAQIDANTIIQQQLNEQKVYEYDRKVVAYLTEQLKMIREDINEFEYIENSKGKNNDVDRVRIQNFYHGSNAVNKFLELYKIYKTEDTSELFMDIYQLEQLKLLLELIDNFLFTVLKEKISFEDKEYLLHNIKYLYKSKIKTHLDYYSYPMEKTDVIYDIVKEINIKLNI